MENGGRRIARSFGKLIVGRQMRARLVLLRPVSGECRRCNDATSQTQRIDGNPPVLGSRKVIGSDDPAQSKDERKSQR